MRGLPDAQRAELTAAVEQLAWTTVRTTLDLPPDAGPDVDLPDAELRSRWLAAVTALLAIRDSADLLAGSAALSAAERGADYPAIGDAAGMTRQGARRKWPGLAGLSDVRQRKIAWWQRHGAEFRESARAVLASDGPRHALLRERLADIEHADPAQRMDAFDMALVDAHAAAMSTVPGDPAAERANGLLAAMTADAYAATSHATPSLDPHRACTSAACTSEPLVELWGTDLGDRPLPFCRAHAVAAMQRTGIRIVAAYAPDVALDVFTEAS
ncbi:hypothetical protein ACQEVB_01725 [Pseudonocardia sp. CA-107938]|uniref:hypothetical protein n=1 Tax=Pseudonocardia sp. CA-107938 TaxID=3240021 RepID=UPI003D8E3BE2